MRLKLHKHNWKIPVFHINSDGSLDLADYYLCLICGHTKGVNGN